MNLSKQVSIISLVALLAACGGDDSSSDSSNMNTDSNSSNISQPVDGIDTDGDGIPDSKDDDDDNDGIPDSDDPDDDNDGVLDEDEINIDSEALTCQSSSSLSSFNVTNTFSDNNSGTTNEFGKVTFEWDAATSNQAGDVIYTVCEADENNGCITLGQTKDLSLEVATGGALYAMDAEYFIHAQQKGEQSCSSSIEFDNNALNSMSGNLYRSIDTNLSHRPRALNLSSDSQNLLAVTLDHIGGNPIIETYENRNGEWVSIAPSSQGYGRYSDYALHADSFTNIVYNGDECLGCIHVYSLSSNDQWLRVPFEQPLISLDYTHRLPRPDLSKDGHLLTFARSGFNDNGPDIETTISHLYVFKKNNGMWSEVTKLESISKGGLSYNGASISGDGRTLAVRSIDNDDERMTIYTFDGSQLEEQSQMIGLNNTRYYTLNGDGSTLVIHNNDDKGLFIYQKSGSSWDEAQFIEPPHLSKDSYIASTELAEDGNTLTFVAKSTIRNTGVIEANEISIGSKTNYGIYIYKRINGIFELDKVIVSENNITSSTASDDAKNIVYGEDISFESNSTRTY
ncbi:hypothetical protein N9R79_12480 [Vibrio sp.]|nr:hypothetical protein [Vibrio sp.]